MSSVSFVFLQKTGESITKKTKGLTSENLYKKCNFRNDTDFTRHHIWSVMRGNTNYLIAVYGKTKGRAGQENKSELPPPLDTTLFYGGIALVRMDKTTGDFESFTKEEWKPIYEGLYGGFHDLEAHSDKDATDDEVSPEDDEANYDKTELTQSGYLKDDFVISDGSEYAEDIDHVEDIEDTKKTKKPKKTTKKTTKATAPPKTTKTSKAPKAKPAPKGQKKSTKGTKANAKRTKREEAETPMEESNADAEAEPEVEEAEEVEAEVEPELSDEDDDEEDNGDDEDDDDDEEDDDETTHVHDQSDADTVVFEDEYTDSELSEEAFTDEDEEEE